METPWKSAKSCRFTQATESTTRWHHFEYEENISLFNHFFIIPLLLHPVISLVFHAFIKYSLCFTSCSLFGRNCLVRTVYHCSCHKVLHLSHAQEPSTLTQFLIIINMKHIPYTSSSLSIWLFNYVYLVFIWE